ncbi:unnamed protein product [Rangifer tarandus platyrhynchus]|uniref:Uncharacterized protein n=1 Tax=Rangifer tarandus platyrhynchus TaxID=3082113 RepID=A0ABN8ZI48_RANTA|nr:unnamed protein product [Rangifer tarandus platyrhynchus]
MDIPYELSRPFYWMAAVENSNSLTLWRTQQMSMMCQLPLKMLKDWEGKPEMGDHLRETTKRYKIVRKSAKTSGLEEESPKSNVPTDRVLATDSPGNGSTQGPVLYCSGPSTGSLHRSRGRASPAQECRLSALGLAAGSGESLHAGLLDLPRSMRDINSVSSRTPDDLTPVHLETREIPPEPSDADKSPESASHMMDTASDANDYLAKAGHSKLGSRDIEESLLYRRQVNVDTLRRPALLTAEKSVPHSDSHFEYRDMRDEVKSSAPGYTQLGPQPGSARPVPGDAPKPAGRAYRRDARSRLVPADAPGWPRPHRSHLPAPALRRPPAPERPSPDPEMWTRSGRPRLEQDDRSLCERPRGLGSPGSLRRAGAGSPAGVSGSGTSAAACPAGSPGGSAGLLPASAIGSRRPGARGGAGAADRAARRAATPRQRQGRRRLDAGRGEAGGEGGRRKRTEKFVQEGAAYSRLSLPRAKAAGLGAGPPSVPASLPAAPPPGPGHGPLQIGGRRVPSGHTQLAGLRLVEPGRQELGMQGQG